MYKNNAVLDDKLMYKNQDFIKLSSNVNKGVIYNWLEILNQALNDMRFSTQKRAYLELAILKMSDVKLNDLSSLTDRVESLENSVSMLIKQEKNMRMNNNYNQQSQFMNKSNVPSVNDLQNMRNEIVKPIVEETVIVRDTKTDNVEETDNYVEPVVLKNNPANDVIPEDEINITDVENILNNSSKDNRAKLENALKDIEGKYSYVYMQMLTRGKIIAVSDDKALIELADAKFCNRLMEYDTFVKVIEILREYDIKINDYVCIPREVWSSIRLDFKSKYSQQNPKPKLNPIRIGVKRRVIPQVTERQINPEDKLENDAKDLIGEDLKIVEE